MIVIKTDRIKAIYCRTHKNTPWRYAKYGGRWKTNEEAIEKAKEHYGDTPFEYMIKDWDTNEVIYGSVNQ